MAVTLSIANHDASLPMAYRLYLPKSWADDRARRDRAGVPAEISFKTKPEIALEQIRWACEVGLPRGFGLLDAGYGHDSELRTGMTELGVPYVAGIQPQTLVWEPRKRPGRAPKKGRRDEPNAISVKDLALKLDAKNGTQSDGGKARTNGCRRGLPVPVFAPHRVRKVRRNR